MSGDPLRIRLSPALRNLLSRVSPNNNAAIRALLLLGARTAGYDLSTCRADTSRLLGEKLDDPVRAALDQIYGVHRPDNRQEDYTGATQGPHGGHTRTTGAFPTTRLTADDSAEPDDPLATVGLEV